MNTSDNEAISGLREIIAEAHRERETLRQALTELELRTRQFISGELVTFPASLLPQVQMLLRTPPTMKELAARGRRKVQP